MWKVEYGVTVFFLFRQTMSVMGIEGEGLEYLCNLGHWDFRSDDSSSSFCESDVFSRPPDLLNLKLPLLSSPLLTASHHIFYPPSLCLEKLHAGHVWDIRRVRTEALLQSFSACSYSASGHKQGQWVLVSWERADKRYWEVHCLI